LRSAGLSLEMGNKTRILMGKIHEEREAEMDTTEKY
jgi:hypothetical protein